MEQGCLLLYHLSVDILGFGRIAGYSKKTEEV